MESTLCTYRSHKMTPAYMYVYNEWPEHTYMNTIYVHNIAIIWFGIMLG